MNLYITADQVGMETGGGKVTFHESEALKSLDDHNFTWGGNELHKALHQLTEQEPWLWDQLAGYRLTEGLFNEKGLAHFYAGTFSTSVTYLKSLGFKITYTAAAHNVQVSKEEHEKLGVKYDYPHLTDPSLFSRYVRGYLEADVLICPSNHSADVMRGFGATNRIQIIPHGCDMPEEIKPFPETFTVGSLGSVGAPDKGIIYLLMAWKKLNYKDAVLKLGGSESASEWMFALIERYGGGNIHLAGWQESLNDYYSSLSLHIQPSVTEGFGIEILEAQAHGRPSISSDGAGGADVASVVFRSRDVDRLSEIIDDFKKNSSKLDSAGASARENAVQYTWKNIRIMYINLWRFLLGENKK